MTLRWWEEAIVVVAGTLAGLGVVVGLRYWLGTTFATVIAATLTVPVGCGLGLVAGVRLVRCRRRRGG